MAKRGIKINELAKEIGVPSRQVLDRCRAEGIPVQNSISKLSPDIERLVREWFGPTAARDE